MVLSIFSILHYSILHKQSDPVYSYVDNSVIFISEKQVIVWFYHSLNNCQPTEEPLGLITVLRVVPEMEQC